MKWRIILHELSTAFYNSHLYPTEMENLLLSFYTFTFYFCPISGICVTYCDGEVEWRGIVNNWYIQINASYPDM